MNSKQRVLNTFARERADRVPVDFAYNEGICRRLMLHYGARDLEALLLALRVDFRKLEAPYRGPLIFERREGLEVDPIYGHYTKWVPNDFGGYWDYCWFPLQAADPELIASYPVPDPDDFDYSQLRAQAQRFGEFALYCGDAGMADIINSTGRVMGMEDALVNLLSGDEATLTYVRRRCDMQLKVLERTIEAAGGAIDFLWMGEDLGTQTAPMISTELYRSVLRPIHQQYIDLARSHDLPVMVHSCGSSSWVYPDFIEMGVSCVDTLQPEAVNMSPRYLAERFGNSLCFHGCISTAGPLAYGTPDDVERQVRETMEVMKPYRGYMLAPTHQIQDNTPVENVARMYECACRYGAYE